MRNHKILLFDFGGVLVEWDGIEPLLELTDNRISADQARRFWLESDWVRKFERGWCSPEEFASGAITELEISLTPGEFIRAFMTWDRGPLPGAIELLERLRGRVPLACLSNNNSLHWTRLDREYDLLKFFDYCFVSHEIGLVKPDRAVFDHVISELPFEPGEIVFFDDNPECVETASTIGIQSYQTKGIEELKSALKRIGYEFDAD